MPKCKDCYLYKPVDVKKGLCLDLEVSSEMAAEKCKQKAFRPKFLGV